METCEHCGAKMVEYRHGLTEPLVKGLQALHQRGGGPINLSELELTRNQWDNFQKLRYFGLVERVYQDGKRASGVWRITDRGTAFIADHLGIPRVAVTYRGEVVRSEGPTIYLSDVVEGYEKREDFIANALPHHP